MKTDKTSWKSGDKTVQKSVHHQGLFIVNHADGTFHTVSSSTDIMKRKYSEDGQKK